MNKAYSQAVKSGRYAEGCGLRGKYDHVRTHWEDGVTADRLAPFVSKLVQRRRRESRPLRILELGCGSGDGLAFLRRLSEPAAPIDRHETVCLGPADIGAYVGVDINEDLIAEAKSRFAGNEWASFALADLSQGLPVPPDDPPYDIYFTSFGTLSHFHDADTVRLFADIAGHASPGSIVICDWLGRYSYEWQNLWRQPGDDEEWMDYRISYIYSEEERRERRIDSFPLKLVTREGIESMVAQAAGDSGVHLGIKRVFDRSTLVGRHIETGEYNGNPMLLREAVNSLWEPGVRTDLDRLKATYRPKAGFDEQNSFFARLIDNWNNLVEHARALWAAGPAAEETQVLSRAQCDDSDAMSTLCRSLDASMNAVHWYQGDDVRADVLEPQLAAALRNLEMRMQDGQAIGHGLVAVLEVAQR